MLFNLVCDKNIIFSCLFIYFLIIDLYVLIHAVCAQIFNSNAELEMPTKLPTKEAKAEMKAYPVTAEAKISTFSIKFGTLETFLRFLRINSFRFISSMK